MMDFDFPVSMWSPSYFWFCLKAAILAVPYVIAGALLAPFLPPLHEEAAALLLLGVTILGFLIMVFDYDEDDLQTQKHLVPIKGIFLVMGVYVAACISNLDADAPLFHGFSIPFYLIATKIFFKINITSFFDDA